MDSGTVYLVGAGPGHPGLITLRGVEVIKRADVILYDYLANVAILSHASPEAELICLGQHRRSDIWPQEAIHAEMVDRAQQGQTVVRLKGGDPMVFGRAAEELNALYQAGIPFEVVPGVTTASAAAAFAGVTITDRGFSSAVALITGHEQLGKPQSALDYESLANFPGTLVIYMGVRTAGQWSQSLLAAGKSADTPVLLIRRCSWPDQRKVTCTLSDVADKLSSYKDFPPPAIVIVGEAACAHPEFDWFSNLPLLGQNIVITRPAHQADEMVQRLSELGANPVVQPAIEIDRPSSWEPVDHVQSRLAEFDFLVFSSANGVHFFMRRLMESGGDARALSGTQLAVIGPRTADALREYSLNADLQPDTYRAESLAEEICQSGSLDGKKLLLLRASRGREVLSEMLRSAGGEVEQVVVYESRDVLTLAPPAKEADFHADWLTVTSSAIARSVVALWGDRLSNVKIASISPITSDTLRKLGVEPTVEATVYTANGVIEAIQDAYSSN